VPNVVTQQIEPMAFVAAFGFGQRQQDLAFFTRAPIGQIPIDDGLGTLVGQMLAPTAQIPGTDRSRTGGRT
jgi:hypothetical protein